MPWGSLPVGLFISYLVWARRDRLASRRLQLLWVGLRPPILLRTRGWRVGVGLFIGKAWGLHTSWINQEGG